MESLPEECLLYLLSFVEQNTLSLHALLLTNRTLFRLVAPILYKDPLGRLETRSGTTTTTITTTISIDRDRLPPPKLLLLRLLLACCSPHTLQALSHHRPRATFLPPPTINYLELYKHHSEKLLYNVLSLAFPLAKSRANPSEPDQPQPDITKHPLRPRRPAPPPAPVHQALVGHSPQNIHTISFSMHTIDVLEPLVTRLSSLVRLELLKASDRTLLSVPQTFITNHRQHFSSLQEIKIVAASRTDTMDYSCLIEAMGKPRVIDVTLWTNADRYLNRFPLDQCRVLLMRLTTPSTISCPDPAILAQCTQLQTVRIPVFHQDIFSWAKGTYHTQEQPLVENNKLLERHVGLRSISLQGLDSLMAPAIVSACDGFHSTLRELSGLSSFGDPIGTPLSWQWTLAHLTRLDLEGTIATNFDLDSLTYCPVLTFLRLNVGRKIPDGWNAMGKAKQLGHVSHQLRQLELSGYWGLPDAALTGPLLAVLKRLCRLNLTWCRGPSVDCYLELLPQLTGLAWLGISASPQAEQEILELKRTHNLVMDIDIPRLEIESAMDTDIQQRLEMEDGIDVGIQQRLETEDGMDADIAGLEIEDTLDTDIPQLE